MPTGVYIRTKLHKEIIRKNAYKISLAKRGKPAPWMIGEKNIAKRADVRLKISQALKGRKSPNKGKSNWWKKGALHNNWKGGITVGKENRKFYSHMKALERLCRKRKNGGTFTKEEWDDVKKRFNFTCPNCNRSEPKIKLTMDHIVPVVKNGTNYIANIQPLCQSCNTKKNTKIICFCYLGNVST